MSEKIVGSSMNSKVAEAIARVDMGKGVNVCYSNYEFDKDDNPIDNLDDIIVKGECMFCAERDEYWGGSESQDFVSPMLTNPTNLDLCIVANQAVRKTRDMHHVFFEGVYLEQGERLRKKFNVPENVTLYSLAMGS